MGDGEVIGDGEVVFDEDYVLVLFGLGVSGATITGADCTIAFCDSCSNEDLVCNECPAGYIHSLTKKSCLREYTSKTLA